jgi:hypothetical protein
MLLEHAEPPRQPLKAGRFEGAAYARATGATQAAPARPDRQFMALPVAASSGTTLPPFT